MCGPGTDLGSVELPGGGGTSVQMCIECQPGQYCQDGRTSTPCPLGTFNPVARAQYIDACEPCSAGSTTARRGTASDEECIAIVVSCPAGTAGTNCDDCPAGTSSPGGNVLQCAVCKPGTVSRAVQRSNMCVECPEHTYMSQNGAALVSSCLACPDGLRSNIGSSVCSGCPGNMLFDAETRSCRAKP